MPFPVPGWSGQLTQHWGCPATRFPVFGTHQSPPHPAPQPASLLVIVPRRLPGVAVGSLAPASSSLGCSWDTQGAPAPSPCLAPAGGCSEPSLSLPSCPAARLPSCPPHSSPAKTEAMAALWLCCGAHCPLVPLKHALDVPGPWKHAGLQGHLPTLQILLPCPRGGGRNRS